MTDRAPSQRDELISRSGDEPRVSILIPVYNEEESVEILAGEIRSALAESGWSYEVIFVDDGSSDGSAEVLGRLAAADPRVRVLIHRRNAGQSAALWSAIQAARGEIAVTLDADLQNDPADIPRVLAELDPDCAVVSGIRARRQDSWRRRVASRIANRVRDAVIHDGITDVGCSLKAYRLDLLRRVPPFKGMHRFLPALVQMEGGRSKEIEVNHRPRRFGEAKYTIGNRLWRTLADLAGVRWLGRRHIPKELARETTPQTRPTD